MNIPFKPARPYFASGPCAKPPGWSVEALSPALVGRSTRSIEGKAVLATLIERVKETLEIPASYRVAIVPGSATGAVECLLWSLLGPRPVDILSFDVFTQLWAYDIATQLKLPHRLMASPVFGQMPSLDTLDLTDDWVFGWNGSTSGLCFPDGDWIPEDRQGLTVCDATSAAFACHLPWEKLDATAFSLQKGLGSEAGHGIIVLSPRAVERLTSYTPPWPIPRVFRLMKTEGYLNEGVFHGETLNTPSLLCVQDAHVALDWVQAQGGLAALIKRTQSNYGCVKEWVSTQSQFTFVVAEDQYRSSTTVCLQRCNPLQDRYAEWVYLRSHLKELAQQGVAYDIANHAVCPPSLRIWCGPTVERPDIQALLPWLTWSFRE